MAEYQDYGFNNDHNTHAHSYLLNPLLNLLGDQKKLTVLDLGCGNGSLAKAMLAKGYNVYGTDASEKGIAIASIGHPNRFAVQNLESDGLPQELKDIKFNTIISTEVIEHLYHPRKFIKFAKKVLKEHGGGELIISTPYHGYLKNIVISINGKWDTHMNPLWDGGHIKMWSRRTLTKLLEDEGYQVTAFKGCGRFPYLWKSMMIKATIS